jgi:hypothetical protein
VKILDPGDFHVFSSRRVPSIAQAAAPSEDPNLREFRRALVDETAGILPGTWLRVDAVARRMRIDFDEAERWPWIAPNVAGLSTAFILSGSRRQAATSSATSDVDIATKSVDGGLSDLT